MFVNLLNRIPEVSELLPLISFKLSECSATIFLWMKLLIELLLPNLLGITNMRGDGAIPILVICAIDDEHIIFRLDVLFQS